jgi:DNA-binding MarR family transcriptional regulator
VVAACELLGLLVVEGLRWPVRSDGMLGGPDGFAIKIAGMCNHCYMHEVRSEQDSVIDAVLTASRVLVAVAARSLAEVADEVTLTQYRALVVLASRGPQSLAALADELAVTASTASRLCDRLVRKRLVRRREDPRDRRAVRLALTPEGRALVDAVTERRRTEIADLLKGIPDEAQRSMVQALRLLGQAAGEVPEQQWSTGWDL